VRQYESKQKFIHQVMSQGELLAEAALTEYHNYISLKQLIQL
jgi:hypothetical protein